MVGDVHSFLFIFWYYVFKYIYIYDIFHIHIANTKAKTKKQTIAHLKYSQNFSLQHPFFVAMNYNGRVVYPAPGQFDLRIA